jgi:hypothetical protein
MTSGGEPGLFIATPGGSGLTAEEGQRLGSMTGMLAFGWLGATESREASLLALGRSNQSSKPLVVRDLDPATGAPRTMMVALPSGVGGSGQAAARWDGAHGRLLVMARHDNSSSSLLDYWLVQLQAQEGVE